MSFSNFVNCLPLGANFVLGNKPSQSKTVVGNFCSRRARFTEKILRGQVKRKKSFTGHSIFEKKNFKISYIY